MPCQGDVQESCLLLGFVTNTPALYFQKNKLSCSNRAANGIGIGFKNREGGGRCFKDCLSG